MQPSPSILNEIKAHEALRLKAYMPTPNDVPTIGYGSTGPDIKLGMTWTLEQAERRFAAHCSTLANQMSAVLVGVPTTQKQFDAMFSLAYNIGFSAWARSTVLREHKAKNYVKAQNAFLMWVKQKGKTLRGLVTRRKREADVYDD